MGLRDDDAAVHTYDAAALSQHDLDLARVLPVAGRVTLCKRGRLDLAKVDQTALGLADDLVRHDEHVAGTQIPRYRARDHTVQVVTGADLGKDLDTKHLEPLHGHAAPASLRRARSPAVSRSKARWGRSQILTSRPRRRSEEHTSELQSHSDLVCRLLLEKKKKTRTIIRRTKKNTIKNINI